MEKRSALGQVADVTMTERCSQWARHSPEGNFLPGAADQCRRLHLTQARFLLPTEADPRSLCCQMHSLALLLSAYTSAAEWRVT